MTTLFYVDQYTDESMPCEPTLKAWADWLADPAKHGDEIEPANAGDTFSLSTIEILGDVRVEFEDGRWQVQGDVPDGTTWFYMRRFEGDDGWDVEQSADTVADACDCLDEDDSPVWFACTRSGPEYVGTLVFEAGQPRLQIAATPPPEEAQR